jgi:hypothetical protein
VTLDAGASLYVTMNAYDPAGSGANTREAILDVANVGSPSFGALFTRAVDGDQYAQPLYAQGVRLAGGVTKNVVYVATSNDSVYAFDADDPAAATPLWKVSVGTPSPVPNRFVANNNASVADCKRFNNFIRELGVTSTPALDPATGTLYVLAADVDDTVGVKGWTCTYRDPGAANYCETYPCTAPLYRTRLHALDATTGAERPGSPVDVTGSVPGSGAGSVSGTIPFDSMQSFARTGLLLAYGNVYFGATGYGDAGVYHGWVFAYDAATLAQVGVFNDTTQGEKGGIWQSGRSVISDGLGYVYVVTGNGTFTAGNGGSDYGDSVIKLRADLSAVVDYFSPFLSEYDGNPAYNLLFNWDDDLGSAGATLIPGTTLLLATGKLGNGYVLDTGNLGKWSPTADHVAQEVRLAWKTNKVSCDDGVTQAAVNGTPVVWTGPDGTHVYVWAAYDYLRDYLLDGSAKFASEGVCFCASDWVVSGPGGPLTIDVPDPACGVPNSEGTVAALGVGGALSVSSSGARAGTGILWVTHATSGRPGTAAAPGVIEAYDATNVHTPLWSSATNAARDGIGEWAKYAPPIVANGKVYVPTFSNKLVVYGLSAE